MRAEPGRAHSPPCPPLPLQHTPASTPLTRAPTVTTHLTHLTHLTHPPTHPSTSSHLTHPPMQEVRDAMTFSPLPHHVEEARAMGLPDACSKFTWWEAHSWYSWYSTVIEVGGGGLGGWVGG